MYCNIYLLFFFVSIYCFALYSRCTIIVCLTNHVSCMSVWRWLWFVGWPTFEDFSKWRWAHFGEMITASHQSNLYGIILNLYVEEVASQQRRFYSINKNIKREVDLNK